MLHCYTNIWEFSLQRGHSQIINRKNPGLGRKTGHTKEARWFLYGKPANGKPRSIETKGNTASFHTLEDTTENDAPKTSPLSKEQIEMLQKLLQQTMKTDSTSRTASVAHKGNYFNALSACKGRTSDWIVDSEASNHMTRDFNTFRKYYPCHENSTLRIANGTHSKVTISYCV